MTALGILSILFGVVLGQRLKVLVLLPAIAIGWVVTGGVAALSGWGLAAIAGAFAVVAVGLQAGYLAGLSLRAVLGGLRVRRRAAARAGQPVVQHSRTVAS